MLKISIVVSCYYNKNKLFDINNLFLNRDNCNYHWYLFKQKCNDLGIDVATSDINLPEDSDLIIYSDMSTIKDINNKKNNFLILFESELIHKDNWTVKYHKYFDKIFVWNDDWVDGEKYIKYYWPNKIPDSINFNSSEKIKFCTMIVGNKFKLHPLELYSERINTIRYFEQNCLENFDLFGMGWDKPIFKGCFQKLNRIAFLFKFLKIKYPSYKGIVDSKIDILKKFKFSICYENAKDIPGYITEKIFDSFFAGCVPIYWGAPNINNFIPKGTFVNRREFKDNQELYVYLKNMKNNEYENYLVKIKSFLTSEKAKLFSAESFVSIILNSIDSTLNVK
ncbi:MAG: glycosyltransferase family 10 [Clostridiales bacterium]